MSSPVLWYATRATGIVALVLLTATAVLGLLTARRSSSPRWPGVAVQDLHRRLSLLSVAFVGCHVVTAVLDSYVHIGWGAIVVPFASPYKSLWVGFGAIGLDLFLAVLVTSLLRQRMPARVWRGVHWLAYLSWPVAVAHSLGMGTDMRLAWVLALVAACVATVVATAAARVVALAASRRRALMLASVGRRLPPVPAKHVRATR
jgi:methionine sulfoxide reductase heme-binding subunit